MPISSPHPVPPGGPRRTRRRRTALAAASVALLSVAAAGCGHGAASGSPASATGTTGAPLTSSATATPGAPAGAAGDTAGGAPTEPTGSGAPGSTAPPAATPKAPPPRAATARCTVTGLRMTLGRGDPGAGNIYYPIDFTNTTSRACTLDGFPGVSLLRGDGTVIGRPAVRRGAGAATVRLAPGQTVEADLHTLNEGVKSGGCWRAPTLIMVYPPGSTDSMTLATSNPVVCGGTFDVGPVH